MRFTLGAICEVLAQRRYAATVAYLPAAASRSASLDSAKAVIAPAYPTMLSCALTARLELFPCHPLNLRLNCHAWIFNYQ